MHCLSQEMRNALAVPVVGGERGLRFRNVRRGVTQWPRRGDLSTFIQNALTDRNCDRLVSRNCGTAGKNLKTRLCGQSQRHRLLIGETDAKEGISTVSPSPVKLLYPAKLGDGPIGRGKSDTEGGPQVLYPIVTLRAETIAVDGAVDGIEQPYRRRPNSPSP